MHHVHPHEQASCIGIMGSCETSHLTHYAPNTTASHSMAPTAHIHICCTSSPRPSVLPTDEEPNFDKELMSTISANPDSGPQKYNSKTAIPHTTLAYITQSIHDVSALLDSPSVVQLILSTGNFPQRIRKFAGSSISQQAETIYSSAQRSAVSEFAKRLI